MGEITKIKVNGDPESSYQLSPINEEFAKRVDSADGIGIQSDWNEEDDTSPAFILNKPESLGGGYAYYYLSTETRTVNSITTKHNYLYKISKYTEIPTSFGFTWASTQAGFEEDYYNRPILLVVPDRSYGEQKVPLIYYGFNKSHATDKTIKYIMQADDNAITQNTLEWGGGGPTQTNTETSTSTSTSTSTTTTTTTTSTSTST